MTARNTAYMERSFDPLRGFVSFDTVEELKAFFQQWKGVIVPVGQKPGAYNDTYSTYEMRPAWVCGGCVDDEPHIVRKYDGPGNFIA